MEQEKTIECPHCREHIESLNYDVTATCGGNFDLDSSDNNYDLSCLIDNVEIGNFNCPECGGHICDSEEVAKEVLGGNIEFAFNVTYFDIFGLQVEETELDYEDYNHAKDLFYDEFGHMETEEISKIEFKYLWRKR